MRVCVIFCQILVHPVSEALLGWIGSLHSDLVAVRLRQSRPRR